MIHEFALDPACLNNWPTFKYVIDQCGVHHGRLISRFPRRWQKEAISRCIIEGVKRTAVVEKLRNMEHKLINSNRNYSSERDWLENAENQHEIKFFHAIISCENPRNHEKVLIAEDIDETIELWNVPREKIVPRKAYDLAVCARSLLNVSKEIMMIDPHFNPELPRFRDTFSHIINFIFENNKPRRCELHVEYKESIKKPPLPLDIWQERCQNYLSPILPEGSQLRVFRWKEKPGGDKPHARYILTERGGIRYDYGLDESDDEGRTTDVSLLAQTVYEKRWKDYQKETAAYDPLDELLIQGLNKVTMDSFSTPR